MSDLVAPGLYSKQCRKSLLNRPVIAPLPALGVPRGYQQQEHDSAYLHGEILLWQSETQPLFAVIIVISPIPVLEYCGGTLIPPLQALVLLADGSRSQKNA